MADYQKVNKKTHDDFVTLCSDAKKVTDGIAKSINQTARDFDFIIFALNELQISIDKKNMERAEQLNLVIWRKMYSLPGYPEAEMKQNRPLDEIRKFLDKNSKIGGIKKICEKMSRMVKFAQELSSAMNKAQTVINILKTVNALSENGQYDVSIASENAPPGDDINKEMKEATKKFMEFTNIAQEMADIAPYGISTYLKVNLEILQKANVVFNIADKYSKNIVTLANEADVFYEAMNNPNSAISGTFAARRLKNDHLINDSLDVTFGNNNNKPQRQSQSGSQKEIERQKKASAPKSIWPF